MSRHRNPSPSPTAILAVARPPRGVLVFSGARRKRDPARATFLWRTFFSTPPPLGRELRLTGFGGLGT